MELILTEKPSVARDIARVLNVSAKRDGFLEGNGYVITWALGHLLELSQPNAYDPLYEQWQLDRLPIIPETFRREPIERTKDHYAIVKRLLSRSDLVSIVCATDAGREGELIFRLIYEDSGCTLPIKRLWISSQTDEAIRDGFRQLKHGDDYLPLYYSARARSEADWIVGINATRAYSIKFSRGRGVMSVGRVQTPVLKMIVDRYRANQDFQSSHFYEILADVIHVNGAFQAKWMGNEGSRILDESVATELSKRLANETKATIAALDQKTITEKQPLLYDLTSLQKDANRLYNYSADYTLTVIQALYETHKIVSYPRTSSRYLTTDIAPKCPEYITILSELPEFSQATQTIIDNGYTIADRMIDDGKVTDHHAIIPTNKSPVMANLSVSENHIYDMIIRRFLAAFFPVCRKQSTDIHMTIATESFKASGMVIVSPGWRAMYPKTDHDADILLPAVMAGDNVDIAAIRLKKGKTKAPPLYTEATVLAAMETAGKSVDDDDLRQAMKDCGLGTPATRAQILEKLISVCYIERKKNALVPTPKGMYLIDCMLSDELVSAELTGRWEKALNDIAQSKASWIDYMNDIKQFSKNMIQKVVDNTDYVVSSDEVILGSCPLCHSGHVVSRLKSYSCTRWKSDNCSFVIWKQMAKKAITEAQARQLVKTGSTKLIKGFKRTNGEPFDARLIVADGKVGFQFEQVVLGTCRICQSGSVVETAKAYSCNQWKHTGCRFVIWKTIASRPITVDEAKELLASRELNDMDGFKTRSGESFQSSLMITDDGQVQFKPRVGS
jgi:DNA topoisomerase-3